MGRKTTADAATGRASRSKGRRSADEGSRLRERYSIDYEEDRGVLIVSGGCEPAEVQVEGTAQAPSGRCYLLFFPLDGRVEESMESALRGWLGAQSSLDWDLVDAQLLHKRWGELSLSERDRLARREGFRLTRSLSFPST